jgi:outer membrane protein assembly factor BamD (BamD/ComL family)
VALKQPAPTSEKDFAAGVGSMARGDFGEAIDRLSAFRKGHPHDARSEDAAFLVIVALERAGRHSAASAAAREYLASYPAGYRHHEAEAIAARRD